MGRVGAQFLTHLPDMIYIFSVGVFLNMAGPFTIRSVGSK